ncbi:hypothetical protein C9I90_05740 [Photobacterium aphoticum]|uniref:Uncharacterized protein n=1 Tax=Photobacterium aphoticum TaxID=754436 RepID=A0A0J1JIK0_9GAMM|nr:hypothetical protein [Photobacterium aphoticum]KLV01792.1 hypothetical protein ABT58_05020 [Photobacterium aphoticum]PSU58722.1 hypothetical protein C9I90_05740 [Photobacterium aphoticum]
MDAKKALKKLKKKMHTHNDSQRALAGLKPNVVRQRSVNDAFKGEIKQISQDTLRSLASELTTPFNPLLSWFNEGYAGPSMFSAGDSVARKTTTGSASSSKPNNGFTVASVAPQSTSLAKLPLKSPPCKRCPAMSGGMCKCAMKKFGLKAA